VLLLDRVGELPAVFAAADVAVVGGSLVPVGGHNLLEPIFSGRAALFGPHCENARELAALVLADGGGVQVADASGLAEALETALADPEAWQQRGRRGREALASHAGATERTLRLLRSVGGVPR
jgi:3-deoxy-D-manno-octulosonic-acid transferase